VHAQTPAIKTLRLASTPWSPFTNEPGKARFALDLVHAALERAGISANTTIVEEGKLTSSLLKGDYDGSAALWKDAERERTLLYSHSYLENRLILVGRKGSDVTATKLSALKGKRIALVETYAYGDEIRNSGAVYVKSTSEEDSLQKVISSDVAYTLLDELVVEYILKNYPDQAKKYLAFGSTPLLVRTLHFAVRKDLPGAASIIDKFNSELTTLVADRTYHRLLQLDWIQADVDGQTVNIPRTDQAGTAPPNQPPQLPPRPPGKLLIAIDNELSRRQKRRLIDLGQSPFARSNFDQNDTFSRRFHQRHQRRHERRFPAAMLADDLPPPVIRLQPLNDCLG